MAENFEPRSADSFDAERKRGRHEYLRHLQKRDWSNLDLRRARFSDAFLAGVDFSESSLEEADFSRAYLEGAVFRNVSAERAVFLEATAQYAVMESADFSNAEFGGASLRGSSIWLSHFDGAGLTTSSRSAHWKYEPDVRYVYKKLTGADLSHVYAQEAHFVDADLRYANLEYGWFRGADFERANLSWVKLAGSSMFDVYMKDAAVFFVDFTKLEMTPRCEAIFEALGNGSTSFFSRGGQCRRPDFWIADLPADYSFECWRNWKADIERYPSEQCSHFGIPPPDSVRQPSP